MCLGQCLGRRGHGLSLGRWSLSPPSGSRLPPMESLGREGRAHSTGLSLRSPCMRRGWTDAGDRNFLAQGVSGEGRSKGIRKEKEGIHFDTQARMVSGRALVGAEGEEVSWEALSAFSRNWNWIGGDCLVGGYEEGGSEIALWGTLVRQKKPRVETDPTSNVWKTPVFDRGCHEVIPRDRVKGHFLCPEGSGCILRHWVLFFLLPWTKCLAEKCTESIQHYLWNEWMN